MTTELAVLNWNQYVLYPQGTPADQLRYQATLRLPHDWHYGTALAVAKESGDEIEFQPTSLATLIDSPVSAGAHYKTIELGTFNGAPHYIHIAADSERALAMPPETVEHYKQVDRRSGRAVRLAPLPQLSLSADAQRPCGQLRPGASRIERRPPGRADAARRRPADIIYAELLPHEYVHSWNGKYRRPAGLATKDYNEPMQRRFVVDVRRPHRISGLGAGDPQRYGAAGIVSRAAGVRDFASGV